MQQCAEAIPTLSDGASCLSAPHSSIGATASAYRCEAGQSRASFTAIGGSALNRLPTKLRHSSSSSESEHSDNDDDYEGGGPAKRPSNGGGGFAMAQPIAIGREGVASEALTSGGYGQKRTGKKNNIWGSVLQVNNESE